MCRRIKATNKFWDNFVVECDAPVPKKYRREPKNHDKAKWISQNGMVKLITKLDDIHLANIYRMLFKSEDMSKEEINIIMNEDFGAVAMSPIFPNVLIQAQENLIYIQVQLHHIAYEVYKRGIFLNRFDKFEKIKTS
jgi:hypothetical protein